MLSLILIIIILILSVRNSSIISESVYQVLDVLIYILIPSLFFMMITSKLLKSNTIIIKAISFLARWLKKIFNFENDIEVYILFFSLLSGNPTSQILISDSYKNNEISYKEANRLSKFLCFSSPIYLYKTTIMLSPKAVFPIIFTTYFVPLLGLYLTSSKEKRSYNTKIKAVEANLNEVIFTSASSLFKISTFVFFFTVIFNMLYKELNLNEIAAFYLSNVLDLTVSINHIYHYNLVIDMALYIFFNTFLGLSIHLQIKSQAPHLEYLTFLNMRIILSIISSLYIVIFYFAPYITFFVIAIAYAYKKRSHNDLLFNS